MFEDEESRDRKHYACYGAADPSNEIKGK